MKYLGVISANPTEYAEKYNRHLKGAEELPQFVLDIKQPEGLTLAAEMSKQDHVFELEGQVEALILIDLDKEGLSEYK